MIISSIHIYPIKSLGGIDLKEARVTERGLEYDRRWMLVDENGVFVTQRTVPTMALISCVLQKPWLKVFLKSKPENAVLIPLEPDSQLWPRLRPRVEVWSQLVTAWVAPVEINLWFSEQLESNVRLVYMPDTSRRLADGRYVPNQLVSFADGFPLLVVGQASLDDLNTRLATPVPMNRFRPNLVFSGGEAFEEETWRDFTVGNIPFRGVKPCGRCQIITTDQETAERSAEPLKTLATFKKRGNSVIFGQNVVWAGEGEAIVYVGDPIRREIGEVSNESVIINP